MKLPFQKKNEEEKLHVVSKDAPFQYVEAYKSLRTNLNFMAVSGEYKKIVITSTIPNEGKSNVALNLGITLGEADKKILIVDCDLRKPVLHKFLHLSRKTNGLTTVLSGKCTLDSAIVIFKDIKIDVLTAGAIPPNPTEILASEKMEKLVTELSKRYDYIIFDTPPVSVVTDAAVLGRLADGALLVIRQKFATSEAVRAAKQNLESVGVHVIGAVLSRFDYKTLSKDRGYYANYEYNYVQHAGTDS